MTSHMYVIVQVSFIHCVCRQGTIQEPYPGTAWVWWESWAGAESQAQVQATVQVIKPYSWSTAGYRVMSYTFLLHTGFVHLHLCVLLVLCTYIHMCVATYIRISTAFSLLWRPMYYVVLRTYVQVQQSIHFEFCYYIHSYTQYLWPVFFLSCL